MSRTNRPLRAPVLPSLLAVLAIALAACQGAATASSSPSAPPPATIPPTPSPTAPATPAPTTPPTDGPAPTNPAPPASTAPPASVPPVDPAALAGPLWTLVRMAGEDIPADAGVDVRFEASGNLGGSGGCNEFGGQYLLDGASIQIGNVVSTLIGCEEVVSAREAAFFAALEAVESWTVSEGGLTLAGPEGTDPLEFQAASDEGLQDRDWALIRLGGSDIPADAGITARFEADGRIDGSGGCNNYFGDYTVDGDQVTIGQVASTKIGCPGVIGDRETAFFTALAAVESWSITDGQLSLNTPAASDPLVFEAVAP